MFYVVNTLTWPVEESVKRFRTYDSACAYVDRRARKVLHAYGEPEARRYVSNVIIYTRRRDYYSYVFRNGGFIFLVIFAIIFYAAWISW